MHYPLPKTTKEIKLFLGLVGFYRKFIKNFAKFKQPLTPCLKKEAKIVHNNEFLETFQTCKNMLTTKSLLTLTNSNISTDARNCAIGSILYQGAIDKATIIPHASRTLNSTKLNYSTTEKQLLAVVWGTKAFRQ